MINNYLHTFYQNPNAESACNIVQVAMLLQYYCEQTIKFFADHSMYLTFLNVNPKSVVIYILYI